MHAEAPRLPGRDDGWDTNCVPYEAFLGPHPAVGGGAATAAHAERAPSSSGLHELLQQQRRRLSARWLGGACWLGFLEPPQLRALPRHFKPLTFVASEGPLPDVVPLDVLDRIAMFTVLRNPLDRTLSAYRWWRVMTQRFPDSPGVVGTVRGGESSSARRLLPAAQPATPSAHPPQPSAARMLPPPTPRWRSGWRRRQETGRRASWWGERHSTRAARSPPRT